LRGSGARLYGEAGHRRHGKEEDWEKEHGPDYHRSGEPRTRGAAFHLYSIRDAPNQPGLPHGVLGHREASASMIASAAARTTASTGRSDMAVPVERATRTRAPSGDHTVGDVGPNRARVGAPTAAARWETPESLPMDREGPRQGWRRAKATRGARLVLPRMAALGFAPPRPAACPGGTPGSPRAKRFREVRRWRGSARRPSGLAERTRRTELHEGRGDALRTTRPGARA